MTPVIAYNSLIYFEPWLAELAELAELADTGGLLADHWRTWRSMSWRTPGGLLADAGGKVCQVPRS